MDKQLLIEKTRKLKTRTDFLNLVNEIKADLLGNKCYPFTMKQLSILCNPKNENGRYKTFEIPKKSGGTRQICAPCGNLKWFQLCVNELLKSLYTPSPYATGFVNGKSIVDNARIHTNQNYVFNIDLKDFFPSIDQARVWKRLQLAPFNFNPTIASIIAGLCTMMSIRYTEEEVFSKCYILPQGAPTSPLLTNAICDTLDRRLHGLAKRFGLHYSRYADDITFSSMHNVYQTNSDFCKELERIITEQNFTINTAKTRLSHCSKRQEVTGLTVGSKINVSRKYVKDLRAILHIWEKYGYDAAYATFYPRYKSEKCQLHRGEPNLINIISGKLCYLKMVKGETDPVYMKLNTQFISLNTSLGKNQSKSKIEYLFTISKDDFEKKLGVTIKFKERAHDKKIYGCFKFQDRDFVVAVSKNINIKSLQKNVQLSLTRMKVPKESYQIIPNESHESFSVAIQYKTRIGYLLHNPLLGYQSRINNNENIQIVSSELKKFVVNIANTYPELQAKEELGMIETNDNENLLARLVESNFDLSILP